MKTDKNGRIRLGRNEHRYGNFIYKVEEGHIKIFDINSALTHRVSRSLNVGRMIEVAIAEKRENWLHNYASMVWLFSNIVTDEQFFLDVDRACVECVNRHKEFYGIKEDISVEEDNEILREAEETIGAIEDLKKEE